MHLTIEREIFSILFGGGHAGSILIYSILCAHIPDDAGMEFAHVFHPVYETTACTLDFLKHVGVARTGHVQGSHGDCTAHVQPSSKQRHQIGSQPAVIVQPYCHRVACDEHRIDGAGQSPG